MDFSSLARGASSLSTYLASVKDGGKDRERLIEELEALGLALEPLDAAHGDQSWSENVQFLEKLDGVKRKISDKLRELNDKFIQKEGLERVVQTFKWPLDRADGERDVQHVMRLFQLLTTVHVQANSIAMAEVKLRSICDWLSPLNPRGTQQSKFKQAYAGTGNWFLNSRVYQSWKDDKGSILWCPGIPGAGKSVLSSIIVDDLQKRPRSGLDPSQKSVVLMIYFAFDDANSLSPDLILGSLLKQVLQSRATPPGRVLKKFQEHRRHGTRPDQEELVSALKFELAKFEEIYIVMDGLDELQEEKRRSLVESVVGLNDKTNLLVTSRLLHSIRDIFGLPVNEVLYCRGCEAQFCLPSNSAFDLTKTRSLEPHHFFYHCMGCKEDFNLCHTCYDKCDDSRKGLVFVRRYCSLRQDISAHEEDLRSYIESRVESLYYLKYCAGRKEGLRDLICQRVTESARGMFLQAKFHMKSLANQRTPRGIIKALETLPTEIDETYKLAMERIARIEHVKQFLMWVAYSYEPLSTRAIEHTTAVATLTPCATRIDPDDIIPAQQLASMCGGLVIIDEAQNVSLCHYTAKEYFRKNRDELFPKSTVTLARACLKYLLHPQSCLDLPDASFPFMPGNGDPDASWDDGLFSNRDEESRDDDLFSNSKVKFASLPFMPRNWDDLFSNSKVKFASLPFMPLDWNEPFSKINAKHLVLSQIGRNQDASLPFMPWNWDDEKFSNSNVKLARACLRYLLLPQIGRNRDGRLPSMLWNQEANLPFMPYVVLFWTHHCLENPDEEGDCIVRGLTSKELDRLIRGLRSLTLLDRIVRGGIVRRDVGLLIKDLTSEELGWIRRIVGGWMSEDLGRLDPLFKGLTSEERGRLDGGGLTREELAGESLGGLHPSLICTFEGQEYWLLRQMFRMG